MGCGISPFACRLYLLFFSSFRVLSRRQHSCFSFSISPETGGVITAHEFSDLDFLFTFNKSCDGLENFVITVFKNGSIRCNIRHKDGRCSVSTAVTICSCTARDGVYQFRKHVDRSDSTTWTWTVMEGTREILRDNIAFNITYPALVKHLTLNGYEGSSLQIFSINETVEVVCSWEKGSQPISARLLDGQGATLQSSDSNANISHVFKTVTCQDVGAIFCEADGSQRNKSALLLVDCPPKFSDFSVKNFTVVVGRNAELKFPVRKYVTKIVNCELSRYAHSMETVDEPFANVQECDVYIPALNPAFSEQRKAQSLVSSFFEGKCLCTLRGELLNMTVIVHFSKVSKYDRGRWHLKMSNHLGSDNIDIFLNVTEEPSTNLILTTSVISGITAFIILALVFVFIWYRKGKRLHGHLKSSRQNEILQNKMVNTGASNRPNSQQSHQDQHPYEEIHAIQEESEIDTHSNLKRSDYNSEEHDYLQPIKKLDCRPQKTDYLEPIHVTSGKHDAPAIDCVTTTTGKTSACVINQT